MLSLAHPSGQFHPRDEATSATQDPEKRITVWNKVDGRKLSGNAAPKLKNLAVYLAKNPNCEVYISQDKEKSRKSWAGAGASISQSPSAGSHPVTIPTTTQQAPSASNTSPFDTDTSLTPVGNFCFEQLLSETPVEPALCVGVLSPQLAYVMQQTACSPISSIGSPSLTPSSTTHKPSDFDLRKIDANLGDDVFDFMEE